MLKYVKTLTKKGYTNSEKNEKSEGFAKMK